MSPISSPTRRRGSPRSGAIAADSLARNCCSAAARTTAIGSSTGRVGSRRPRPSGTPGIRAYDRAHSQQRGDPSGTRIGRVRRRCARLARVVRLGAAPDRGARSHRNPDARLRPLSGRPYGQCDVVRARRRSRSGACMARGRRERRELRRSARRASTRWSSSRLPHRDCASSRSRKKLCATFPAAFQQGMWASGARESSAISTTMRRRRGCGAATAGDAAARRRVLVHAGTPEELARKTKELAAVARPTGARSARSLLRVRCSRSTPTGASICRGSSSASPTAFRSRSFAAHRGGRCAPRATVSVVRRNRRGTPTTRQCSSFAVDRREPRSAALPARPRTGSFPPAPGILHATREPASATSVPMDPFSSFASSIRPMRSFARARRSHGEPGQHDEERRNVTTDGASTQVDWSTLADLKMRGVRGGVARFRRPRRAPTALRRDRHPSNVVVTGPLHPGTDPQGCAAKLAGRARLVGRSQNGSSLVRNADARRRATVGAVARQRLSLRRRGSARRRLPVRRPHPACESARHAAAFDAGGLAGQGCGSSAPDPPRGARVRV